MQKMTGARYIAEALNGYGVTHVFFVPAILRRTMAEMEARTEIKRIRTNGEKAAAYMADGYARASGRPGVCMAQHVGALNLAAGIRDAHLACCPLVAITGGATPQNKYRKAYQTNDDLMAFEQITKFNATVDHVCRIPDLLRQAFRLATSGTPGPVHLQFEGQEGQIDLQEADMDVEMMVEKRFTRVPGFRPEPQMDHVHELARVLAAAKRPVIVSGGGVRWSGAGQEVVALAEKLQIPIAHSLNGKGALPGTHPLLVGAVGRYSRKSANRVMQEADLVFFIGSQAGGMTTFGWQVPAFGKPAVQLDINPESLGRNYPVRASILGDAKVSLKKLIEVADGATAGSRKEWIERVQTIVAEWREEITPMLESDAVPIRPERICKELTDLLPSDGLLVVDTGHAGMWAGGLFDLTKPEQGYIRSAGHLGWAFPASLGAKCGCPERPVFCFTGDAGFWYHIGEIETAIRWGINAVIVVNNNHSGNQSSQGFKKAYNGKPTEKSHELWHLSKVNFAKIAEAIGAMGIRVEHPAELKGAIERAASADRLAVIDVVTDIDAVAPVAFI
jgi:acetolactate synthase I/II/III large subunit